MEINLKHFQMLDAGAQRTVDGSLTKRQHENIRRMAEDEGWSIPDIVYSTGLQDSTVRSSIRQTKGAAWYQDYLARMREQRNGH